MHPPRLEGPPFLCQTEICREVKKYPFSGVPDKLNLSLSKLFQVMYMYYFLGFRLWAQENDARRKQIQADNTFLLALDGDVDFQPKAVQVPLNFIQ